MSNTPEFRHILVLDDQKSRRIITLEESSYVIGRDPSSTIFLNDFQASRHHATLIRVTDYATHQFSFRLIDGNLQGQKSDNGLLINGKKTFSHGLKPGDLIQFGASSKASYLIVDADADLASLPLNEALDSSPDRPQSSLPSTPTEISPGIISAKNQLQTSPLQNSSYNISNSDSFALSSAEYSPFPIFELDFSGQLTYINLAAKQSFPDLSPTTRNHPLLHHLLDLIDPSHLSETTRSVRTIQINNSYFEQHIHYFRENKLIRCYVIDDSRYHRLKWRYSRAKERYALFDRLGTEGFFLVNAAQKQVVEANSVFCRWLGYSAKELLTLTLYQLLDFSELGDRAALDRQLEEITTETPLNLEKSLYRRQDGSLVPFSVKISRVIYLNRDTYGFVVQESRVQEIRDRLLRDEGQDELLAQQTPQSPLLSQLLDRAGFSQQLSLALEHAQQQHHGLSVLFINLDSFKYLNSTYSHAVGDRVLEEFATRLLSLIKPRDSLARWGGDEFCLLLTQVKTTEEPANLATRIFENLLQPFAIDDHQILVKSSIGIALYPQDGEDAATLLQRADTALHLTKQQGKNHYQFYQPRLSAEASKLLQIETHFHQALEQKQLVLQYQPQVELTTGNIVGIEALPAWNHPEKGIIPSSQFLPLIAKTDLAITLGQWVLQSACEQILSWQQAGFPPLAIALKLSTREFQQENLSEILARTLEKAQLDPQWLELELTELTLRQNLGLSQKTLAQLQQLGLRIALDDYGTGVSSLGYLNQLSFNTIKIHPSLLQNLRKESPEKGIIAAILAIAQSLNRRVVANGVETEAQGEILRQLNAKIMQGAWVSEPLSAEEMTAFIRDRLE